MEYMKCNFSGYMQSYVTSVRIEAQWIIQRDFFQYLGSIISKNGEIEEDAEHKSWIVDVMTQTLISINNYLKLCRPLALIS